MEFKEPRPKTPPKLFGQHFNMDFNDVTILSTPRPQASSTVERKTFGTEQYGRVPKNPTRRNSELENSTLNSLGLVNNITSLLEEHDKSVLESSTMINNKIETERELARQLIQQCDLGKQFSPEIEINKENNANAQNLSALHSLNNSTLQWATPKTSSNNVVFEPTEFSGRSSEMNSSNEHNSSAKLSQGRVNDFSFNSTAADIMAKFSDGEFVPGSRMSSQFAADELSCQQNYNAIPPSAGSERMEFSCFSGIVGEPNLTVQSCPGHQVSVGEYFRRKCGGMGSLSDNSQVAEQPSFGLTTMKSPDRARIKRQPLLKASESVNETPRMIESTVHEGTEIMSLTKIAQALQNVDGTPGHLVDQLLMINRKQNLKKKSANQDTSIPTYTLAEESLPEISSSLLDTSSKSAKKLSFDSKTFVQPVDKQNTSLDESKKRATAVDNINLKIKNSFSPISSVKTEQPSLLSTSRLHDRITINKSTQELYRCVVGVAREAPIEIQNNSERWFKCTLKLLQIQGDANNVQINVPVEPFMVEPSKQQIVRLTVKLEKMGEPIMAAYAVEIVDMSTREVFTKQHMMCFVPELSGNPSKDIQVKSSNLTEESVKVASRCVTPQTYSRLGDNSCPTSPQSRTSSGTSGRHSPRSTSSAGTVSGDSIPIKSTHSSLVWTSVRVGKYETREFTIRNTSSSKIKLQGIITDNDNCFKFIKGRDSSAIITFGLQHMESKTFTVAFSPNSTGAAAGKITFMHYEKKRENRESSRPSRIIPLYGYGGYAKVCISQALKIMGDQMWLSLGKLSSTGTLNTRIKLENTGDLSAYAKISLAPKAVYPSVENNWQIEPTELILGPKEIRWVSLNFRPRKEDFCTLRGDVADMGSLIITHGDEPTRWRIRRLYNKLCEAGQMKKNEQEDIFRNVVYPICKAFPGESLMSHNLNIIRDSVQDLGTLCRRVNRHVVTLTIELSGDDDTISIFNDDDDDFDGSQMFQSLCSDVTAVHVVNENSYMPPDSRKAASGPPICTDELTVMPETIALHPPSCADAHIDIESSSSTAQPFETTLEHPQCLSVVPSEGMIPARGTIRIKIHCKKRTDRSIDSKLQIYTANEKRDVVIKIRPN